MPMPDDAGGPRGGDPRPGPADSLVDVPGVRVGQVQRRGGGWRTGVTAVLFPPDGAVAGVQVSGGAPCTHETDLLDPRNLVERVHAISLSGGSVFGLAATGGITDWLADHRHGLPAGPDPAEVIPLVPGASIYDLGRGGRFRAVPGAEMGAGACAAATGGPFAQGSAGAGTGAVAGGLAGGVGTASQVTAAGFTVAALAVVNASGSPVDPRTGELYGARYGLPGEFAGLRRPGRPEPVLVTTGYRKVPRSTTLAVLATDARLDRGRCGRLAVAAHDGMARTVRPIHTLLDGDAAFAVSLGEREPDFAAFHELLGAAADVFVRAALRGILHAEGWPGVPSYREAYPSAFPA
ncbi:P1 family peptidase [Actinomadura fibrosa]|uniref:P1 family peptidase n=1 Tax=Actinomadura fibrosa TaxID=111802 RepID=A0ABW2XW09_9ACTN|nr:P1 family peptidase [Actinomadura fibrosa]